MYKDNSCLLYTSMCVCVCVCVCSILEGKNTIWGGDSRGKHKKSHIKTDLKVVLVLEHQPARNKFLYITVLEMIYYKSSLNTAYGPKLIVPYIVDLKYTKNESHRCLFKFLRKLLKSVNNWIPKNNV